MIDIAIVTQTEQRARERSVQLNALKKEYEHRVTYFEKNRIINKIIEGSHRYSQRTKNQQKKQHLSINTHEYDKALDKNMQKYVIKVNLDKTNIQTQTQLQNIILKLQQNFSCQQSPQNKKDRQIQTPEQIITKNAPKSSSLPVLKINETKIIGENNKGNKIQQQISECLLRMGLLSNKHPGKLLLQKQNALNMNYLRNLIQNQLPSQRSANITTFQNKEKKHKISKFYSSNRQSLLQNSEDDIQKNPQNNLINIMKNFKLQQKCLQKTDFKIIQEWKKQNNQMNRMDKKLDQVMNLNFCDSSNVLI